MQLSEAAVRATVAVSDLRRAIEFYEGTLGLSPVDEEMDGVRVYACGAGTWLQVYESQHAGGTQASVASWTVPDVAALVDGLSARGVTFQRYDQLPSDERGVHAFGEHRVAWFTDPDGNTLAVDNGRSY